MTQPIGPRRRLALFGKRIFIDTRPWRRWALNGCLATLVLLPGAVAAVTQSPASRGTEGKQLVRTNTAWEWHETELGAVPSKADVVGQPFEHEHGWNYGVVVQTATGRRLWLNGQFGPAFADFVQALIMDAGLVFDYEFSPDGKRLAYAVRHGGQMYMIVDGRPDPGEEAVRHPVFSPDSLHLAYIIKRNGKEYLQVDGVPGPACDTVGGPVEFSPDGRRIAYYVRHGKEYRMVIDQKERPDWPGIGRPVFSPDSKRLAYSMKGGSVVVDGVKGPEWGANTWWGPIFSTDSRHFAYSTGTWTQKTPRHSRAFIDGEPLPLPDQGTNVLHVFFSPNLRRWACSIDRGSKKQAYVDGQLGPVYDSVYGLRFSTDSSRYAYLAKQGQDWWMVVDGSLETEISIGPSSPQFSPEGKRLAYIAGRGPTWWVVVDGKASPRFRGPKGQGGLWTPEEIELPAVTTPQFSPDSRHVAYGVYDNGSWSVRVDDQSLGGNFDKIIRQGPCFREDGTLEFLGIRDGKLYRVSAKSRQNG